jgi:hypothetical protein
MVARGAPPLKQFRQRIASGQTSKAHAEGVGYRAPVLIGCIVDSARILDRPLPVLPELIVGPRQDLVFR